MQTKLWPYMAGIARNHGFEAIKVGGVEDHAHALLILPPTILLSKAIQTIKARSSKWLNETEAIKNFAWQKGYGAFSVSAQQTAEVIRYIENQVYHHAKHSYEDEFLDLLAKYGAKYDPKYVHAPETTVLVCQLLGLRALFTGLCVLAQDGLNVMAYQVSRAGRKRTCTVRLIFQRKVLAYEGGWQRLVFEVRE